MLTNEEIKKAEKELKEKEVDMDKIIDSISNIYFNNTNDFPHPVGNTTAAFPFSLNSFSTSVYASSWCGNNSNLLF